MPIGSGPNTPEINIAKPLSVEEFQKLGVGDKFWLVQSSNSNDNHSRMRYISLGGADVVGPIEICQQIPGRTPVVYIKLPNSKESFPESVEELVIERKVFRTEKEARSVYKKTVN